MIPPITDAPVAPAVPMAPAIPVPVPIFYPSMFDRWVIPF